MKPPANVKTPAQYIASLPADRAKTIATMRAFVNAHIPRGYDECLVWGAPDVFFGTQVWAARATLVGSASGKRATTDIGQARLLERRRLSIAELPGSA